MQPRERQHFALHKPRGYCCSHNPDEAPIIDELLPLDVLRLVPEAVGRLDRETSGLLILTTDGQLNYRLTQPGSQVGKRYRVRYRGDLPPDAADVFAAGIVIHGSDQPTRPAELTIDEAGKLQSRASPERLGRATLVLHEGRYHQVRRMFAALDTRVVELHRDRIGAYELSPDLEPGRYSVLSEQDLSLLETPDFAEIRLDPVDPTT